MTTIPTSTLGQLLFSPAPHMNFARIVSDLDHALAAATRAHWQLTWDHDDVATFDQDGVRILLGMAEDLPGPWPACLTVSVGHGPRPGDCPMTPRQTALARMIADRIAARLRPQQVLWHRLQAVADAALVDDLLELLPARAAAPAFAPTPDIAADPARFPDVDSGLLPGTLARVEVALAARAKAEAEAEADTDAPPLPLVGRAVRRAAAMLSADRRPQVPPETVPAVANDLPDLPHPDLAQAAAIRAALYAPLPEDEVARPTVQLRLAAHAMNATLMVVALPVGASLMTYTLLRGENLRLSARAMALIGAGIGVLQSPFGEALLPLI